MNYGFSLPNFGAAWHPRLLADLAYEAEQAGWDGVFLWDHISFGVEMPMGDPWVALAAMAMRTERVKLGPMVTPLARRRPWKVARETVSLDHLTHGRLILGVGLGHPPSKDFSDFGDAADGKVRAEQLDEGLAILAGLWSGDPFRFVGKHYAIQETRFLPRPVQSPRIPIWVAGYWPHHAPLRRAARWDGLAFGGHWSGAPVTPADLQKVVTTVQSERPADLPFDVMWGTALADDPEARAATIAAYGAAGVTWWVEGVDPWRDSVEVIHAQIRRGPPR